MHLPNYYERVWINLLDVESSPAKYWPVSIYQVGVTSVCYVYQKICYLADFATRPFDDSAHKFWNVWWFRTRILHTPSTTFSFNWILVTLPDPFYTHRPCWSFYLDHWAHSFSKVNLFNKYVYIARPMVFTEPWCNVISSQQHWCQYRDALLWLSTCWQWESCSAFMLSREYWPCK